MTGGEARGETGIGLVSLVGAGPGDPELLTLRAWRLIRDAQALVYDRLVSPEVLNLAEPGTELIDAGKACGDHSLPQGQINALLIRLARQGKRVVRLKGGDPFVFGRGGEELQALARAGIPFQVVPGITAASGCATYAGIPLTHRDYVQSVTFVTAHSKEGAAEHLDWKALAQPRQTLVIYMGLQALPTIRTELIRHGCPATLPAALIEHGSTPRQRVIVGKLQDLPELAIARRVVSPGLIIIGDVVRLREELAWFQAFNTPAYPAPAPDSA